jgi:hypothetical protein
MTVGLTTPKYIYPYFSAISEDYQNVITKFTPSWSSQTHPASQHTSSHMNGTDIKANRLETPFRSVTLPGIATQN